MQTSGIVLYAKKRGPTSFNSLNKIKKSLQTKKVGHTGTLDSFAEGLLVVMVGSLTRLASHVTAFDKKYEAIISFGTETDTLDPFGEVIQSTQLPLLDDFNIAFKNHTGSLQQFPPQYSAIHIDGKRASDIARSGKTIEMPSREVTVFSSQILDVKEIDGRVQYAHVAFHVSKGTYIRSLARDIAKMCGSCAHLIALRRSAVGSFLLENAVGYESMSPFTILQAVENLSIGENISAKDTSEDTLKAIQNNLKSMTKPLAIECGMQIAVLKNDFDFHYFNGKPLKKAMFAIDDLIETNYAVFDEKEVFIGVVKYEKNRFSYGYVIPR